MSAVAGASTRLSASAEPAEGETLDVVVSDAGAVADGVVALTLADPDGKSLPPWTPGAHIDVHIAPGVVRQYSLCSDPDDRAHYRIAVLRVPDGRGGSAAVHETLRTGTRVTVSRPRNRFELVDAESYVLVAGGIGITPLLPMARALEAGGRPWRMLYGGRSRRTMAFLDELPAARVTVAPQDETGRPDLAAFLAGHERSTVYVCGPSGLLDAVRERHAGPVHTELFTATVQSGDAFDVRLARAGITVAVAENVSILDAVRAAGVDAPSSCELGICGTCETAVLAGTPEHRDDLLTEDEKASGRTMLICVSRCRSGAMVLDL